MKGESFVKRNRMPQLLAFFVLAVLLIGQVTFAQDKATSITKQGLREHLQFLASDELEGRRTTEHGFDLASQYLASKFQQYGLKSFSSPPTAYFETFDVMKGEGDFENTYFEIVSDNQHRRFEANHGILFFPRSTDSFDITAPIAFVGYGITAPEYNYDDYAGVDVSGKVVLMFNHEPQEKDSTSIFNGNRPTKYYNPAVKADIARQHGAVGMLVVRDPINGHPPIEVTMQRYARYLTKPIIQLPKDAKPLPTFYISDSTATELLKGEGVNLSEYEAQLDKALKGSPIELKGKNVTIHIAMKNVQKVSTRNVVGYIEGSDPKLKEEFVIIGAHYDHLGKDEKGIYHGADDDASGTAGVLELAKAFVQTSEKAKRSMMFIFFAGEEEGALGSLYHTDHPLIPLDKVDVMFQLDMIGRNGGVSYRELNDSLLNQKRANTLMLYCAGDSKTLQEIFDKENKKTGLDLVYNNGPEMSGGSDHASFEAKKVPVTFFFTGFHRDYHETTDTVDKINFDKMERIVRLAYLAAYDVANRSEKLKFQEKAPAKPGSAQ